MSNVIQLDDKRFHKVTAGKIINFCNQLDASVYDLLMKENIPPNELLAAMAQRMGKYLSCTDANKEVVVKKLAKIIYTHSKNEV